MKKYLLTMLAVLAGSNMWAQSFSTEDGDNTLVITTDGDMTAQTYADNVSDHMKKGNYGYSKVIVNGNGIISEAFLRAILYSAYAPNTSLVNLDLKGITLKGWKSSSFKASEDDNWQYGQLNISELGLPKAVDNKVPDEAFKFMWNGKLNVVVIPEGTVEIGKYAFDGINSLSSVSFPKTLRKVDDCAFVNCKIENLKFNQGLEFIGNSAFALPSEQTETVLMIPASVKYIGPFAFNFRQYQDVYFQGTKAPLMPVGKAIFYSDWGEGTAFSAHTLMGNSGFDPSPDNLRDDAKGEGFANRENYKNGRVYFCIMHYPSSTSDEDAKDFTDTSRTYETCPEGGTWDYANTPLAVGKEGADPEFKNGMVNAPYIGTKVDYGYQDTYLGRQYIWPSQSQWVRSYIVNSYGYNWDGVTKYRSNLTEEDYATLKEAGFVVGTGEGQYTEDELCKIAHMGTRRFVLVNGDSKSTPEYKITMKPGQWWTLCVPFNMTKKQVLDTFGAHTQLCLFNKVTRDLGVNGKNKIVLYFTQDVLKHSTKNADGTKMKDANGMWSADIATAQDNVADDDVVLWAHESYMIKPYNGEQSDQDAVFVVKNYEAVEGNPLPTVVQSTTTVQSRQASETKEYRFVGNYLGNENARAAKMTIPQYSYVYANTKSDPVYKFRFYTGKTSTWKPNKSLVQTNDRNGGMDDYNNFFGIDKSTPLPAGSKQASVFGGENFGETTGIEDVTIVAGTDTLTPVFNLEGKMVSANGDAAGLPAGIYVKNGQKFMVK